MITWIQRTFQQHFKTIFAVLLAVTIISFIATIGAAPGIGRGDHEIVNRDFFGYNLASNADVGRLESDAVLSVELQAGYNSLNDEQLKSYALRRAAALHLADQLRLPAPTELEVQDFIKKLRAFAGEDGQFDPKRYENFAANIRTNPRFNVDDILRVLNDEVRIESVQALVAGPGYVLPGDVAQELGRSETSWTIAVAEIDYASFKPAIAPSDAELAKYYQENQFHYQVPAQTMAAYIDFPADRYLPGITLTDAEVRARYDADPTRFPKPAPMVPMLTTPAPKSGQANDSTKTSTQAIDALKQELAKGMPPAKPDPAADFAAVRPQVEAAVKHDRAHAAASKEASDLAYALYQSKSSPGPALDSFLASRQLQPKLLAPFAQETPPAELGNSPDVLDAVTKLSADRYYSEAVATPTGAAVLLWKGSVPPHQPALAEVKSKVQADFFESQKHERFLELGRTLRTQLAAAVTSGQNFEKAAAAVAAANSVKIEVKSRPAFTMRDRPKDLNETVIGALDHLDQGQVSELAAAADKGYLVYAIAKKAPDLNPANPRFAVTQAQIAGYMAQVTTSEYLNDLVAVELKRTEPVAPK